MILLYGTAPGLFSSKGSRFLFIVQTVLLTHWDLELTSGRENYAETFFNIVQGVYSCHCWLCNSWRCQVQHGMPLFRSLCVLYDVRCSWKLEELPWECSIIPLFWIFGLWLFLVEDWCLKLEAGWKQVWLSPLKLWTLSTLNMGTLERLVTNLHVAFRDGSLQTHCCSAQLWDDASLRCHLLRTIMLNGLLSCHIPIALSWLKYIFYANNIKCQVRFMLP